MTPLTPDRAALERAVLTDTHLYATLDEPRFISGEYGDDELWALIVAWGEKGRD